MTQNGSGGNTEKNTKPKKALPEALRQNLWQPGQSGNPSGRPKKKPITEIYEKILSDPKNLEIVEKSVIKALSKGQMAMVLQLREMAERVEGKVAQPVEMSGELQVRTLSERMARARERAVGN